MLIFAIWVGLVAIVSFNLSWLMFWLQHELVAGALSVITILATMTLLVMGLNGIIEYAAAAMGF